jgi:hypothetical protein
MQIRIKHNRVVNAQYANKNLNQYRVYLNPEYALALAGGTRRIRCNLLQLLMLLKTSGTVCTLIWKRSESVSSEYKFSMQQSAFLQSRNSVWSNLHRWALRSTNESD